MKFEPVVTSNRLIYKYSAISLNSLKNIINTSLYFSSPNEFNDPFDCRFVLQLNDITINGVKSFYKGKSLSKDTLRSKIDLFKKDKNLIVQEIEDDYNQNLRKDFGVTCFSETEDNILMWAHYADNFKGFCLIFDRQIHPEFFQGNKVQYKDEITIAEYDGNRKFESGEIFLTKLKLWEYEREVRSIAKLDGGDNPVKFNPRSLTGVIFGNKMKQSDKKMIKHLIQFHPEYEAVSFYNAIPDYKNKKVQITEEHLSHGGIK
ncbi:MAG: DUF2971 domain-containing protein [Reichenbachiella sp.]|uniref:DUF2971 domain-containing protein n=1 Tax=Reichenbachiella sp. TaxID=2184521 RepID=UPI0032984E80